MSGTLECRTCRCEFDPTNMIHYLPDMCEECWYERYGAAVGRGTSDDNHVAERELLKLCDTLRKQGARDLVDLIIAQLEVKIRDEWRLSCDDRIGDGSPEALECALKIVRDVYWDWLSNGNGRI